MVYDFSLHNISFKAINIRLSRDMANYFVLLLKHLCICITIYLHSRVFMRLCASNHKSINNPLVYVARNDAVRATKSQCTGILIYILICGYVYIYETLATKCAGGIRAVRFDAHGASCRKRICWVILWLSMSVYTTDTCLQGRSINFNCGSGQL